MTQWGLDTLFNPAKRHMDEEKRRLQSTREEVGDNSGGKRIDFESGKVSIKRTGGDPDADDATTDGPEPAEAEATKERAKKEPVKKDLSPAAIRAAERRKRKSG